MSLKAKIEAVIYAAEEPVTLAQLAFLFGGEVLETAAKPGPTSEMQSDAGLVDSASFGPVDSEAAWEDSPLAPQAVAVPHEASLQILPDAESHTSPATEAGEEPASDPTTKGEEATGTADPSASRPLPSAEPDSSLASENAILNEKRAARTRDRTIREGLKSVIAELIEEYSAADRGMEIREIAGGYRVATKPEYHDAVRSFVKSLKPPMKLSLQALETLAVIAYKQPVTAPEVNEIRGVDSGGVLGSLMSRRLITTAGRKQVIGRPILYKTTKEFLLRFGLKDVNELPSIEEFEKMAGDMDIEDEDDGAGTEKSQELPFDDGVEASAGDDLDSGESIAIAANAGEPGVAVSTPPDSDADTEPVTVAAAGDPSTPPVALSNEVTAPKMISLDSRLAEEVDPAAEHELITAVHPSTTVGGE